MSYLGKGLHKRQISAGQAPTVVSHAKNSEGSYSLAVRTSDSDSENIGSIPVRSLTLVFLVFDLVRCKSFLCGLILYLIRALCSKWIAVKLSLRWGSKIHEISFWST